MVFKRFGRPMPGLGRGFFRKAYAMACLQSAGLLSVTFVVTVLLIGSQAEAQTTALGTSLGLGKNGTSSLNTGLSLSNCSNLNPSGEPGCTAAAGNPINVTSGNKFQREVDMAALPGVLGLEIVRYYNSATSHLGVSPSMIGRGWRISYDWALRFDHANQNENLVLVQGDGSEQLLGKQRNKPHVRWSGEWRYYPGHRSARSHFEDDVADGSGCAARPAVRWRSSDR